MFLQSKTKIGLGTVLGLGNSCQSITADWKPVCGNRTCHLWITAKHACNTSDWSSLVLGQWFSILRLAACQGRFITHNWAHQWLWSLTGLGSGDVIMGRGGEAWQTCSMVKYKRQSSELVKDPTNHIFPQLSKGHHERWGWGAGGLRSCSTWTKVPGAMCQQLCFKADVQ